MYIAATMMFPWFKRFQEEGHRKLTTFVFSFLAAVSAAIVIGVYFNQIDPTTYRNIRINDDKSSKTFLDSLPKTAVPTGACSLVQFTDSTGTAPSASCEENAALYGVWFEGATLILAAIICIMMIFDHLKSERAEPVENSKRMTLAAKFKGFWVVMTVFTSFFPYVRLNINPNHPKITPNALQISENYDYGLWNSGPMCRESGEIRRGAKDGRSEATAKTVCHLPTQRTTFYLSLRQLLTSPIIPTLFTIRFTHRSPDVSLHWRPTCR